MRSVAFALLFVFIAVTSFAAVPRLIMPSDDGGDAVVLSAATVRVTIRGHLARTEYELTTLPYTVGREIEKLPLEQRHERVRALVERIASLRSVSARMREYAAACVVAGGEKQFHIVVAEALRADDADLALRVLSDLAEAYADDAPIVRIVARIADGWGRADVARDLLQHALEVSPREPQTWRELILLAAREGRGGELASLRKRHKAAAHDWRMHEVDEQIDRELARVRPGDDARIDEGAALQVELMWDSNYSYVDIHVVEPSGEEVTPHALHSLWRESTQQDTRASYTMRYPVVGKRASARSG
jgi:hypothetical protein